MVLLLVGLTLCACGPRLSTRFIVIDETDNTLSVERVITIDSVWSGHPVGFALYTDRTRQYIAYYNANRNMVVGQRNLDQDNFELHIVPATFRKTAKGTSTVLAWDSHNYVTLAVDKAGHVHLSGNVHGHPLTYFRTTQPHDISTLEQLFEMVGSEEDKTTYPNFMLTKSGELLYHYRDGASGRGNEIYNIYSTPTQTWDRLLDSPLTDGQGKMNAYQTQPTIMKDDWYHVYWVWRDTPDCSTNHDLSYMRSPDLKNWFDAFGSPVELPATIEKKQLIVDPIPVKGGIINLAARLILSKQNRPVFVYHKYDDQGNLQFYSAQIRNNQWVYHQLTNWDYRWEFSGRGTIKFDVSLGDFRERTDGNYELDYKHIEYGTGTFLLDDNFEVIGKVLKSKVAGAEMGLEGSLPELEVRTAGDLGKSPEGVRYLLKWETLGENRDRPREKPWPRPSRLLLYQFRDSS